MWKALLIIFVTSDVSPLGSMAIEFPAAFRTEAACREFLASNSPGALRTVTEIGAAHGIEVLGSVTDCFEDPKGIGKIGRAACRERG